MKKLLVTLCFTLLLPLVAFAQRSTVDPRPLPPRPASATTQQSATWLPKKTPFVPSSTLSSQAVSVGNVQLRMVPVSNWSGAPGKSSHPSLAFVQITPSQQGISRWLKLNPNTFKLPAKISANDTAFVSNLALSVLDNYALELGLKQPSDELSLTRIQTDDLGFNHIRYVQTHDNIPIWGSELIVHTDYTGSITSVNGNLQPGSDFEYDFSISDDQALNHMKSILSTEGLSLDIPTYYQNWAGLPEPKVEKYIYYSSESGHKAVYELSYHAGMAHRETVLMDANTYEILNRFSQICSMDHIISRISDKALEPQPLKSAPDIQIPFNPDQINVLSGTFLNAQGTDLNNVNRQMRVYRDQQGTHIMLWDFDNMNKQNSSLETEIIGGSFLLDARNKDFAQDTEFFFVVSANNTWPDQASVSAHTNTTLTYNYYRNTFNRNGFDDKGTSMISIIHVTSEGQSMGNAFWNGRIMAYGDGDNVFRGFAGSLDVAGHEMSHGVIEYTANLVYQFQSGALNESMADVFGMFIERKNFLLAEDIIQPGFGVAMRDMENPDSEMLHPQLRQPAHMNTYQNLGANEDNGGVHVNSGIPNKASVIIAKAIGLEKTEKIYYRALSQYLTKSSQFIDARRALVQAASDLHGANAPEINVIRQAFDAVGIVDTNENPNPNPNPDPGPDPPPNPGDDPGPGPGPTVPPVPPITGERNLIAFVTLEGQIGILDLTNPLPTLGLIENPQARVRVDTEKLDIGQITTTVSGKELYFINPDRQLYYIDLSDMQVYYFPNLSLFNQGDLWNASIDPTGNYVALVSAYINDATMYIYDGEDIYDIPLIPSTTAQGINANTILYPDVFSWSPNPDVPKIAFDALNQLNLRSGVQQYWSIFEIDFELGKIFNLVPAQPSSLSIGNINYSNTRTDWITFNTMTTQQTDVIVANYEQGVVGSLNLPEQQITDAWRPSFSPDDRFLTFTSPSNQALLFYNFANQEVTGMNLGVAAYNTLWFYYNGSYVNTSDDDDQPDLPVTTTLHPAFPNPFNPTTTIQFELEQSESIQVKMFDVTGRLLKTIASGDFRSGMHRVQLDARGFASGIYFIRLEGGFGTMTQKITLMK